MEKVVIGTKECRAEIAFLGAQLESLQSPDGREYQMVERLRPGAVPHGGGPAPGPHSHRRAHL